MPIKVTILPFMRNDAYSTGQMNSDYQIDMLYHGMCSIPEVEVQQLPKNPIMFKACPKEIIQRSWGSGMTMYGLLDENNTSFDVEDSDLICIGLHHTMSHDLGALHRAVESTVERFGPSRVCVIDGSDFTHFSDDTTSLCHYYKRELTDDRTTAYPIFFSIPEEKFIWADYPAKCHDFSPMIPANYCWEGCPHLSTYIYKTEEDYYLQYQQSFFSICCKKAGWQCGRQSEIVANNSIPYFTDVEEMPKNTWHNFPRELCIDAKRLQGVIPNTVEEFNPEINTYIGDTRQIKGSPAGLIQWDRFDITKYWALLKEIRKYYWENLTTKALARYILEKSLR